MTGPPRCAGCHRRLKHPSPSGYGPVCERRVNGAPPGRAPGLTARPATVEAMPGQTELPLADQLTIWNPA